MLKQLCILSASLSDIIPFSKQVHHCFFPKFQALKAEVQRKVTEWLMWVIRVGAQEVIKFCVRGYKDKLVSADIKEASFYNLNILRPKLLPRKVKT